MHAATCPASLLFDAIQSSNGLACSMRCSIEHPFCEQSTSRVTSVAEKRRSMGTLLDQLPHRVDARYRPLLRVRRGRAAYVRVLYHCACAMRASKRSQQVQCEVDSA